MGNPLFGWPIYSDNSFPVVTPVASGGSFAATLPIANVQDPRLKKVARTTDALAASTKLLFDLGLARPVGVLPVLLPNITKTATPTIRWIGGTTPGASDVYDSGVLQAWPNGPNGILTVEDITNVDGSRMNVWIPIIPPTLKTARYWECDVVDTANVDGRLDFARAAVCGGYTTGQPIPPGATTQLESESEATPADGGAFLYKNRPRRRVERFSVNKVTQAEGLGTIRKMQRQLGISGQFFFVFDPADTTLMYERAFMANLKSLSPLGYSMPGRMDVQFEAVEVL